MIDQEQEILLGRLVVHYKILSKEQASEAIKLWRSTSAATGTDFGSFLVSESYIPPETLPKLLKAREKYLRKQKAKAEPAPSPAAAPVPTAAAPAPSIPLGPAEPVGASTISMPAVSPATVEAANPQAPAVEVQPVVEAQPLFEEAPAVEVQPVVEAQPLFEEEAPAVEVQPVVEAPPAVESLPAVEAQPVAPQAAGDGLLGYAPGVDLVELLKRATALGASDLHVHSGAPLKVRLGGELTNASEIIDHDRAQELVFGILTAEQRAHVEEHMQLDFSYALPGVGRFRANSYHQHRGLDGVFRIIPPTPPTLEDLGLPESLGRFSEFHQGLVLFTGPAGCGKSSTMAAFVRKINAARQDHILTIEDPVEYVFMPDQCVVNQREVGPHTGSFARALRAALREDPDVIVIGEMRDLETIELAMTAAETGHLVLGTLHTASTIPTINRLVGVFPPDAQPQIRTMLSESLRAIISQRLVPRADGQGRVPALEVLVSNKAVGNLIRENRTFQINSILQTGAKEGMCRLDASLEQLVKDGTITQESARRQALDPKKFV